MAQVSAAPRVGGDTPARREPPRGSPAASIKPSGWKRGVALELFLGNKEGKISLLGERGWVNRPVFSFGAEKSSCLSLFFLKEEKSKEREREVNGNTAARGEDYVNIF